VNASSFNMKLVAQRYDRLRAVVPLGTLRAKKDYARASAVFV